MKKLVNSIKSKRKAQNGPSSESMPVPVQVRTAKISEDALLRENSVTESSTVDAKLDSESDGCVLNGQESITPAPPTKGTKDDELRSEDRTKSASETGQSDHSGIQGNDMAFEAFDKHEPKSRIEMVEQSLIEASNSLSETLKVYIDAKGGEDEKPLASLIANDTNLIGGSGPVTAEQLSMAVETVLLKQQGQKPSLASKAGSAIGKLFPLASLALGLGANAAEVSLRLLRSESLLNLP